MHVGSIGRVLVIGYRFSVIGQRREMVTTMAKTHILKCWTEYFDRVWFGDKLFEYRVNDRDYQEGDEVVLRDWDKFEKRYLSRYCTARVGYILRHQVASASPLVPINMVVFSLLNIQRRIEFIPPAGEHTGCRCPNCPELQSPKQECGCCKSMRLAAKCGCQ